MLNFYKYFKVCQKKTERKLSRRELRGKTSKPKKFKLQIVFRLFIFK